VGTGRGKSGERTSNNIDKTLPQKAEEDARRDARPEAEAALKKAKKEFEEDHPSKDWEVKYSRQKESGKALIIPRSPIPDPQGWRHVEAEFRDPVGDDEKGKVSRFRIEVTATATPRTKGGEKARVSENDEKWVPLFDGKSLKGWKLDNGRGKWTVEDGAIVGRMIHSSLFTERNDFRDFHLRVEAKINSRGNSGVVFRCASHGRDPAGYKALDHRSHR
jgi:hypothetical protein